MRRSLRDELQATGLLAQVEAGIEQLLPEAMERAEGTTRLPALHARISLRQSFVVDTTSTSRMGSCQVWRDSTVGRISMSSLPMSTEQRVDTMLHEVAHLLAHVMFDASWSEAAHGPTWKRCARALGAVPRASGFDPQWREAAKELRESRQKIVARCLECDHEVMRMRRSSRDWSQFVHRGCGGRLENVE